jgi:hypothetical protein
MALTGHKCWKALIATIPVPSTSIAKLFEPLYMQREYTLYPHSIGSSSRLFSVPWYHHQDQQLLGLCLTDGKPSALPIYLAGRRTEYSVPRQDYVEEQHLPSAASSDLVRLSGYVEYPQLWGNSRTALHSDCFSTAARMRHVT